MGQTMNQDGKPNEEALQPIYFRITVDGLRAEISTGEFISVNNWNRPKSRAKGAGEKAQIINTTLDRYLSDAKKAS